MKNFFSREFFTKLKGVLRAPDPAMAGEATSPEKEDSEKMRDTRVGLLKQKFKECKHSPDN